VQDNGRGIDPGRVKAKALEKGIISFESSQRLSDAEAVELIFAPGFSTAATVTEVSGRGVGMDIVRTNVERLGGSVEAHNDGGAVFTVRVPVATKVGRA